MYVTGGVAAKRLGVTRQTLLRWRREGNGPPYARIRLESGHYRYFYKEEEIDAFMEERTIIPGEKQGYHV